ncbi:uncharacterized protein HMPREF1541_02538 [Cyphellophora europaea CBS 101466]|uniref:Uncharacterized protein n=1 Tax=Cyphellophora europaea (strain CBS 101466) TaxID=1220924 RepID=W2S641_CYPE1|nr:uncharacterized protein HMPREF1541_02538 [Cyphellophora europaea CBS 101466]ETN43379.1 hypothetical protein HMPREF1541_02538 [Cyphellophora europaea CBS 101466]
MTASPVVLILGAGPNIGAAVGRLFKSNGYKVALASRRVTDGADSDGVLNVQVDLSQPSTVTRAFEKVISALGPPGVVVYNASSTKFVPADSPLDLALDLDAYHRDLAINTTSVLVAAQEAVKSFSGLPESEAKTFIFTGNILNTEPILPLFSAGMGKSATAHLVHASSLAYRKQGYKFYYVDERNEDGTVAGRKIDGDAHAQFFWQLAQDPQQREWLATFVKGKGYKAFPGTNYVKDATT